MYEVKWTLSANRKYYQILEFWIEHNQSAEYAMKIVKEVERIENLLKENPCLGVLVFGAKEPTRRMLVLKNFSLFYIVKEKMVKIVLFFDDRDNPQKLNILK